MKTEKISAFFGKIYQDYKIILLSYFFLIAIAIILFPSTILSSLGSIRLKSVIFALLHEPAVYIPLILLGLFLIANLLWMKKFELKNRLGSIVVILFLTIISGYLLRALYFLPSPDRVIFWSNTFMSADQRLFGTYPAFWLFKHMFPALEWLIINVYMNLTSIVTLWILFLFIYENGVHLKKFIQQYFTANVICFPLWLIFACICPAQMYIANILHQPVPIEIAQVISEGPPTKLLDTTLLKLIQLWTDPTGKSLAISTFPSLHTIWGILLAYSVFYIFRGKKYGWIAITIGIIIAVTNMLGATYLLQHYVVDLLAGIVVALLITKIKFETK